MRVLLVEPANTSIPSDGNMVHVDTALSVYAQQRRDFDEMRAFDKQTRKRNRMAS